MIVPLGRRKAGREHEPPLPEDLADVPQPTADMIDTLSHGSASAFGRAWRRFKRDRLALAALVFVVFIVLVAVFAPAFAPRDPMRNNLARFLEPPGTDYWLGTDELGRDIFSRLIMAGRISIRAAVEATAIAFAIGVPLGLLGGYVGGWTDAAIMRFNDALMSIPPLILAIAIIGMLGPGLTNAMIAIGVVYAPRFMRIVRGSTLIVREEDYVGAARLIGTPRWRIMIRHILPNILSPLIVHTTITMGLAILAEASLSFIGLGAQAPEASWGSMLGTLFKYLDRIPVGVLAPGVAIMLVVLAFNVLGDGIRDAVGRETESRSV